MIGSSSRHSLSSSFAIRSKRNIPTPIPSPSPSPHPPPSSSPISHGIPMSISPFPLNSNSIEFHSKVKRDRDVPSLTIPKEIPKRIKRIKIPTKTENSNPNPNLNVKPKEKDQNQNNNNEDNNDNDIMEDVDDFHLHNDDDISVLSHRSSSSISSIPYYILNNISIWSEDIHDIRHLESRAKGVFTVNTDPTITPIGYQRITGKDSDVSAPLLHSSYFCSQYPSESPSSITFRHVSHQYFYSKMERNLYHLSAKYNEDEFTIIAEWIEECANSFNENYSQSSLPLFSSSLHVPIGLVPIGIHVDDHLIILENLQKKIQKSPKKHFCISVGAEKCGGTMRGMVGEISRKLRETYPIPTRDTERKNSSSSLHHPHHPHLYYYHSAPSSLVLKSKVSSDQKLSSISLLFDWYSEHLSDRNGDNNNLECPLIIIILEDFDGFSPLIIQEFYTFYFSSPSFRSLPIVFLWGISLNFSICQQSLQSNFPINKIHFKSFHMKSQQNLIQNIITKMVTDTLSQSHEELSLSLPVTFRPETIKFFLFDFPFHSPTLSSLLEIIKFIILDHFDTTPFAQILFDFHQQQHSGWGVMEMKPNEIISLGNQMGYANDQWDFICSPPPSPLSLISRLKSDFEKLFSFQRDFSLFFEWFYHIENRAKLFSEIQKTSSASSSVRAMGMEIDKEKGKEFLLSLGSNLSFGASASPSIPKIANYFQNGKMENIIADLWFGVRKWEGMGETFALCVSELKEILLDLEFSKESFVSQQKDLFSSLSSTVHHISDPKKRRSHLLSLATLPTDLKGFQTIRKKIQTFFTAFCAKYLAKISDFRGSKMIIYEGKQTQNLFHCNAKAALYTAFMAAKYYLRENKNQIVPIDLVSNSHRIHEILSNVFYNTKVRNDDENPNPFALSFDSLIPSLSSPFLPLSDAQIIFNLYLESGKFINVADWFESFAHFFKVKTENQNGNTLSPSPSPSSLSIHSVYSPPLPCLWDRFLVILNYFKFFGFIKSTKRRKDHVVKTTMAY